MFSKWIFIYHSVALLAIYLQSCEGKTIHLDFVEHLEECMEYEDMHEYEKCYHIKIAEACVRLNCSAQGESDCYVDSNGTSCVCRNGYIHDNLTNKCVDIDECSHYGSCSQGCLNSAGSHQCVCASGFVLSIDQRTCKVANKFAALLLFSSSDAIRAVSLISDYTYPVKENIAQAVGTSYDGEYVYWTEVQLHSESIVRSRLNGSEMEVGNGRPSAGIAKLINKSDSLRFW